METKIKGRARREFGKSVSDGSTWDGFGVHAENERSVMVQEFHAWIIKRRCEVELEMLHSRGWMLETAPFARAGMNEAETPAQVPMCVLEFASHAMEYVERLGQFELLNSYYELAASRYDESGLQISQEPQVRELWEMFLEEREEQAQTAAAVHSLSAINAALVNIEQRRRCAG